MVIPPKTSIYHEEEFTHTLLKVPYQCIMKLMSQSLSETTVSSLQKTIRELKIQRQELDITIKVLSNHLQQLLNQSQQKKSHKRTKTDG